MPIAQNKYPPQNHSAFLALAEEVERVKKMEGGTAFIVDLIEAVVESQGLVVVDKAEYESLSPGKVEGWREINVNDSVRVKLTARGRELHRWNHEQLVASLPATAKLQYYAPKEDADGWSEWQLWCLMQEFGPHMLMGCEPPFETTIKLPSPSISSRAEDS